MTSDPQSSDFSYKKYSLEQLDNWVHDAINCEDLTAQEIYDTIVKCVDDVVNYHKKELSKSTDLLSLLKGHRELEFGVGNDEPWEYKDDPSPEGKKSWVDFWEETYYPEEHKQYTEEEMNAMCDKAASDQEKDKCREYNLREAEYYNQRAKLDAEYNAIKAAGGYDWTPLPETKQDKVKKWRLPVQQGTIDGVDDYYIEFPNDLLEAADLKEGDKVEWVDKGDGSYLLRKASQPLRMDEC